MTVAAMRPRSYPTRHETTALGARARWRREDRSLRVERVVEALRQAAREAPRIELSTYSSRRAGSSDTSRRTWRHQAMIITPTVRATTSACGSVSTYKAIATASARTTRRGDMARRTASVTLGGVGGASRKG
jgi:hypothetical protein